MALVRRRSEEDLNLLKQEYMLRSHYEDQVVKDDFWVVAKKMRSQPAAPKGIARYFFAQLSGCTNNFCDANLIGEVQFGRLYRGTLGLKSVIVKKWETTDSNSPYHIIFRERHFPYHYKSGDNKARLYDEIKFFEKEKKSQHPNIGKMIGFCSESEEKLCSVYELEPSDSLYNLVEGDNFTWLERIKVIVGFAELLRHLHDENPPNSCYLVRNIDAAHLMVDKDCKPILTDFSMITGGIFSTKDPHDYLLGRLGYIDAFSSICPDFYKRKEPEVFAFGSLLLMLISKRLWKAEFRCTSVRVPSLWALIEYEDMMESSSENMISFSLVHESLHKNEGFFCEDAHNLTMLAVKCVEDDPSERPSMEEVTAELGNLKIVRSCAYEFP